MIPRGDRVRHIQTENMIVLPIRPREMVAIEIKIATIYILNDLEWELNHYFSLIQTNTLAI